MHGKDKFMMIAGAITLVLVLGSSFVFGGDISGASGPDTHADDYLEGLETLTETIPSSGELAAGGNETIAISQGLRIIKNVTAVLTWVDETTRPGIPRLRRYENTPDTFSLSIVPSGGNGTVQQSAANPAGGEGRIELSISRSEAELNAMIDEAIASGTALQDWSVEVVLTDAGDWRTVLPPRFIGFRDDANSYILEVNVEYYDLGDVLLEVIA